MDPRRRDRPFWQLSLREGMLLVVGLAGALALWRNLAHEWSWDEWVDFGIRLLVVLPAVVVLVLLWARSGRDNT